MYGHLGRFVRAGVLTVVVLNLAVLWWPLSGQAATWTSNNVGNDLYWNLDGYQKFRYNLTNQQWWHYAPFGTGWHELGASGAPSDFIGNGSFHDLGNGFSYAYGIAANLGWFKKDGAGGRFAYYYTTGRWINVGNYGAWKYLGNAGLTAAFLGDTAWHDLGNGFSYLYNSAADLGWFSRNGRGGRFGYFYVPGQWIITGNSGGWQNLGAAGVTAGLPTDGLWHDLGNGFAYTYNSAADIGWFRRGGTGRFGYYHSLGRWMSTGNTKGWQWLGEAGLSAQFLGDTGSHNLGNGFDYYYDFGADQGMFAKSGSDRFRYQYDTGRWWSKGDYGTWEILSDTGLSAKFIGDGTTNTINNFWSYRFDGTFGYWLSGGNNRFRYSYLGGGWAHYGPSAGSFDVLSIPFFGPRFVADYSIADPLDVYSGFDYYYENATGRGYWLLGGSIRFSYDYVSGSWYDYPTYGSPYRMGNTGLAVSFVGGAPYFNLGNGWYYTYGLGTNEGQWAQSFAGQIRFTYDYDLGQWYHHDSGTRYELGAGGWSAGNFIGNGSLWDVTVFGGNPWWYKYESALKRGVWYRSFTSPARFSFAYGTNLWYHHDLAGAGYVMALTSPSLGSFVGDGSLHGSTYNGNPWSYEYDYAQDRGLYHNDDSSALRFAYGYTPGQWYHYDAGGTAYLLGGTGRTLSTFIGDGTVRTDVSTGGNPWWFSYDYASDKGSWFLASTGGFARFSFGYGGGQWFHHDSGGGGYALGATGSTPAAFIGDGTRRNVATGFEPWWYSYSYAGDRGYWYVSDAASQNFAYDYADGQWRHYSWNLASRTLGQPGASLSTFIGDGTSNTITALGEDEWQYRFDYGSRFGIWSRPDKGDRFSYDYLNGQWYHLSAFADDSQIGRVQTDVSAFPGSGSWVTAGLTAASDAWSYSYEYLNDLGKWSRLTGPVYSTRFDYDYTNGRWFDTPVFGSRYQLGDDGRSHEFIARGTATDLGTWHGQQWYYTYLYGLNEGWWAIDTSGAGTRFSYAYNTGQWYHHDAFSPYSRYGLGLAGMVAHEYMGSGDPRNVTTQVGQDWYYRYDSLADAGRWSKDGGLDPRFSYFYQNAEWYDNPGPGEAYQLGASGLTGQFIADGTSRTLGTWNNGKWWYTYQYVGNEGWWSRDASASGTRFSFAYNSGQWFHHDVTFGPFTIGGTLASAGDFMGSGGWYGVGNHGGSPYSWYYRYDYETDAGQWSVNDSSSNRFRFTYATGTWGFWERGDRWVDISGTGRSTGNFIGDGAWWSLWDNPAWQLRLGSGTQFWVIPTYYITSGAYLGYNFGTNKWMDGGNGYGLADMTGGSVPYWYYASDAAGFTLLSSDGRWEMQVSPSYYLNHSWYTPGPYHWWVLYADRFSGMRPAWVYNAEAFNGYWVFYGVDSLAFPYNDAWFGVGGGTPSAHRQ